MKLNIQTVIILSDRPVLFFFRFARADWAMQVLVIRNDRCFFFFASRRAIQSHED